MKTNFARHYKFSLSKKTMFLISTIFTILLLAGIAFAISQNASANDEGTNEKVPNYSVSVAAVNQNPDDGGTITKGSLSGDGSGQVRAIGKKLESRSVGQSIWIPDELYANDNDKCIFTGYFWAKSGKQIGESYVGWSYDSIEARFKTARWVTFNSGGNGKVIVKNAAGDIQTDNKLKLIDKTKTVVNKNVVEFYDPSDSTKLEGTVECIPDAQHFFSSWNPNIPETITASATYTANFEFGYALNITWDSEMGDVSHDGSHDFPIYVVPGFQMEVWNDDQAIVLYDTKEKVYGAYIEAFENDDYVFDGWYINGVKLGDDRIPITSDINIEARFVYVHCSLTFKVDDSQWALGSVSTDSLTADYGTKYTLSGDSIVFDHFGSVAAIPKDERYQFDYWTVNKQVLIADGVVHSNMDFVAHFKIKGNWRITGTVVRDNELQEEVPVAYARVIFYYEDEDQSKSHVAAECNADKDGYFSLSIPADVKKGYLDGIDEDYGLYSEEIIKPEGNIDGKKIKLEQDSKYVYFFGNIADQKSYAPVVGADVAFSYDDDGSFVCSQTDAKGTYYLKVDKTRGGGILFVSAYEYILNFKQYQASDIAQKYIVSYSTDILAMGIPNKFNIPQDSLCDGFDCEIYIDNRLRLFDKHITQNICLAPAQNNRAKFSVKGNEVILQYTDFYRGGANVQFVVRPTIKSGGLFFSWVMNGEITPDFEIKDLLSPNTFEPNVGLGVDISGLIRGETETLGQYDPLPDAEVYFTDLDFNVISHTKTNSDSEVNYAFPTLPQGTEGYFIVLKSNYKAFIEKINSQRTSQYTCDIDAILYKIRPGDDAFLYGSVLDNKSGSIIPDAFVALFNEEGEVLASTQSSQSGDYILQYEYGTNGTLVCLADGYKPLIQRFESKEYLENINIKLDKNLNPVTASFNKSDKLLKYEIEVLSSDEKISYCKFDYEDNFNLYFEKDNKYVTSENNVSFIYGNYMFRIIANPIDEYIFKLWDINPVPTKLGFLTVNSEFSPMFTRYYEMNASWDSNFGTVTSTKKPLPFLEEQETTFNLSNNVITFEDNQLIAQAKDAALFMGWFIDGIQLTDGTYVIGDNINFEARFIYKFKTVSFNVEEGQKDMGKVVPNEILATYGDTYTISGSSITVGQEIAEAKSLDTDLYVFDYWTLNGEEVSGSGTIYESMTFVAHFKDRDPWHISGIVYTTQQKEVPVFGATIYAYDISGSAVIDSTISSETGSYSLSISHSKKQISLYAFELNTGYHIEEVNMPESGDDVNLDIVLDLTSQITLIYGNVTKEASASPIEGVDVYFFYDTSGLAPRHITTGKDGSYFFEVSNTIGYGGTLYFLSDGYTIKSKHFSKEEISSTFLLNYSEFLTPSLTQTITFPGDGSCSSIHEKMTFDGKTVLNKSQTSNFSFGVAKEGSKLKVNGDVLTYNYTVMDNKNVEYVLTANNKDGFKFSHWMLNGAEIEDGAEIEISQANELTPVSFAYCEISGSVTEIKEVEGKLPPIKDVEVIFFDSDNRVIASDTTDSEGNWSFEDSIIKGTSGNIAFLKIGYKPQLSPVSSSETKQKSINITTILVKSEESDDCYVYGQVVEKTNTNAEGDPISNAYLMFYNTTTQEYKECYAGTDGTYLMSAQQGEEGYLLCMADGYRPSFTEFKFDEYIKVQNYELEKDSTDVKVNFLDSLNQKCYQIEVMDKTTGEVYADFEYFGSLNLNFPINTNYHVGNNHVTIYGETYNYKFNAVAENNYEFYKWVINPSSEHTGSFNVDTSFTPNFVYQTSPVILNRGEAVNGFNYKYYMNDVLIWDKDEDYVQDESYVNTVITVNEDGVIESHFNAGFEGNGSEVDLWSQVTPKADEGYIYDSLYVNDELLEPGDELVVKSGEYYFGEINYKLAPQPDPPTPEPDDPEIINGAQTGDNNIVLVLSLAVVAVIAGITCIAKAKQRQ